MLEKLIEMDLPQEYQTILCDIERMKFLIREPNDFTTDEIQYAQQRIMERIKQYNSIIL